MLSLFLVVVGTALFKPATSCMVGELYDAHSGASAPSSHAIDHSEFATLDAARIGDVVRALPHGLDTFVGEAGARFSGGQGRRLALARTLRAQDRLEAAAAAYDRALELKPTYDAAALERAALALEMAQPEVAEARLVPLLERRERWADAHALLGRARLMRGDAVGAEGPLRVAIALHDGFAAARADLGWALLRLGRASEADAEFARALELDPLHALPREQMAWRDMLTPGRDT